MRLNNKKKLPYLLKQNKGIGYKKSLDILVENGLSFRNSMNNIKKRKKNLLKRAKNENYNEYRENIKKINENIKQLIKISSYRGFRHVSSLPTRGQRTHTNSRTQKNLSRKRLAIIFK